MSLREREYLENVKRKNVAIISKRIERFCVGQKFGLCGQKIVRQRERERENVIIRGRGREKRAKEKKVLQIWVPRD